MLLARSVTGEQQQFFSPCLDCDTFLLPDIKGNSSGKIRTAHRYFFYHWIVILSVFSKTIFVKDHFYLLLLVSILFTACGESPEASRADKAFDFARAAVLAQTHCSGCHQYPEPDLLNKNTWQFGTLPQMGYRMGIYGDTKRQTLIESNAGGRLVEAQGIFPLEPVLEEEEWQLIQQFYARQAPDRLPLPAKKLMGELPAVKVEIPEFHISPPMVTAIKYHPELKQLFVADAKADYSTINILDQQLESVSTLALPSPISHIDFRGDTVLATLMGGFLPTDDPSGSIVKIFKVGEGEEYKGFTSVIKNLQRPVHTTYTDINADGKEDIIVCEYGNHTGKLSLFLQQPNGRYEQKVLSTDPGATSVAIKDMNKDGLPDIVALMAQGRERIDVYFNQGNGDFGLRTLLQFPPSYGSVGLSLLDWNQDGHEDLLYVNGDNADYSMTFKPYHGLHLFLNDGANNFQKAFFQHQHGAYKAIPYDYDRDGDQDIAMISFFPDLVNAPEEGFLFMENVSTPDSIHFEFSSIPEAASGRWLILEAVDRDNDNFPELILGAFTGMGVTGDNNGAVAGRFHQTSPTLLVLDFK